MDARERQLLLQLTAQILRILLIIAAYACCGCVIYVFGDRMANTTEELFGFALISYLGTLGIHFFLNCIFPEPKSAEDGGDSLAALSPATERSLEILRVFLLVANYLSCGGFGLLAFMVVLLDLLGFGQTGQPLANFAMGVISFVLAFGIHKLINWILLSPED